MVKFLISRPIAVLMSFTACFIIGAVTYFSLPISLLPNIDIPLITVKVSGDNVSARELENTMMAPVRRQLMQVSGISEMKSETQDGGGVIRLSFDFGTDIDLAFIEVNEKIDAAMNSIHKGAVRPKAIKASATDIPVFYLNMTLKNDVPYQQVDEDAFLNMCTISENVIKRRIEQLPQVAMADITGIPRKMLRIIPDSEKMESLGMSISDVEALIFANNVNPGSMLIRDGYYEYNIRIASALHTQEDVENIYFTRNGHLMQLKDICKVKITAHNEMGRSLANGKRAVTLAIIKQGEENMDNLRQGLKETTDYFQKIYPDIEFSITRNQTELLDYTISNLQQNFIVGFILIFLVAVVFIGDVRSPLIIGISMITSVVITFFFFYICQISLNVISLSGLILAVGMMIDNAIIVTENVSQYREKGYMLKRAAIAGTSEMITPMLSSSLTTIAVFVPLVFLSGIAGAIFMDEAFSITTGLLISYLTGIMLLPVLYVLFYRIRIRKYRYSGHIHSRRNGNNGLVCFYDCGIQWVFAHKKLTLAFAAASFPLCMLMFWIIDKEKMPQTKQNELLVCIDWNENIHVDENNRRVNCLLALTDSIVIEHTAYVGRQDYLLETENGYSPTEAELYFHTAHTSDVSKLIQLIKRKIHQTFPSATVTFSPPASLFEKIFTTAAPDLVAELHTLRRSESLDANCIKSIETRIARETGYQPEGIPFRQQLNLEIDRDRLLIYDISYEKVVKVLRTALQDNEVSTLRSYQQYLPISIAGKEKSINEILTATLVETEKRTVNGEKNYIPLRELVRLVPDKDLKTITAGRSGEYIPICFYGIKQVEPIIQGVRKVVNEEKDWEVSFSGNFFDNRKMIGELTIILLISMLLMYFILCAQFESFLQPLIVLAEIPMDIAFGLLLLWMTGHSLNLMSAIGIIVSCGIVVNDSILKLDAINELRKEGKPLLEAIHTAGCRRLRAIIMTTLTTVFAMIPLLFTSDLGSEIQRPLSIAMIGTMLVGLIISLFVIPLIYWFIYQKK